MLCGSAILASKDRDKSGPVDAEKGTKESVTKGCDGKPIADEPTGGNPITINGGAPGLSTLMFTTNLL